MRRTSCSSCGYDDLQLILDLGMSPIADAYTSTPNEISPTYPLQLAVCTGCWLVQLLDVVDHTTLFGTGYSFYSSASKPLSSYHAQYARDILTKYGDLARDLTVEIGCNDGDMLQNFMHANCRAIGVDPSGGPVQLAVSRGLSVINEPFTYDVAKLILSEHKNGAGVVIANHVLAHVENVHDTLSGMATVMRRDGVGFIEVQYLPDLLTNNAFDLVYHEHRNFFSLTSLEKALMQHGLYVIDAELTDRQGGSLRVVVSHQRVPNASVEMIRASEDWLRIRSSYSGLQGRVERIRTRLREGLFTRKYVADGAPIIGYGAPAKATTLLNFCGIDSRIINWVFDSTSAKQGRFIPGTGIPILPPDDSAMMHVDATLILAWNYANVIMRMNDQYVNGHHSWIIPIPAPIML